MLLTCPVEDCMRLAGVAWGAHNRGQLRYKESSTHKLGTTDENEVIFFRIFSLVFATVSIS